MENEIITNDGNLKKILTERLENDPKKTIKLMLAVLLFSIVISVLYSLLQKPYVRKPIKMSNVSSASISSGINDVVKATTSLNELNELDNSIQQILVKKKLTRNDSLQLLQSLDRLKVLQEQLKPNGK